MQFCVCAALLAALALSAFASADPLGSGPTYYKTGLRESAFVQVVTEGPEGNVWFVDSGLASGVTGIGKINGSGTISEYLGGTNLKGLNPGSELTAIATGPDGNLWITDRGATPAIAAVKPGSPETTIEEKEFSTGLNAGSQPQGIVAGPDGNLWFADAGTTKAIGMINPSTHEIKEFSEGLNAGSKPQGITAGPDGNLWFTDTGTTRAVGMIDPESHEIKEFATGSGTLPGGGNQPYGPWGIAPGADGNVWFTNAQNPKSGICRIEVSGENKIKCFEEGLASSSEPLGLTAVPGSGKLWFTDNSGVSEEQALEINATESLGGTYKLGFGGKETGATGKGNLFSSAKGKGTIKRWPNAVENATCTRKTGSNELTGCTKEPAGKAEVGMRIAGTGIPTETLITKVEGTTITMSKASTSGGAGSSTTNITAGRVLISETTSGKYEKGQSVTGTGFPAGSTIFSVEETEGKVTSIAAQPTTNTNGLTSASGTATEPSASTTTVVTGVANAAEYTVGLVIKGTGIPAETTITAINTSQETLTLSATPEAGTAVSLTADLSYKAVGTLIQAALEKLSTVGTGGNVIASGTGTTPPIKRSFIFEQKLGNADIEQLSCNGAGLTGTSPTCSVTTTAQGVPNAIGRISTSTGAITRYPDAGLLWNGNGITSGPGGNVWFATGFTENQKLGKFGLEPEVLTVKKTGTGTGTVTSSPSGEDPAGINCGSECKAGFELNQKVKLSQEAAKGSKFTGWSGACSGTGECEVTMSEAKEVKANFDLIPYPLTVKKTGSGSGTVTSSPSGINCGSECSAEFNYGTEVTLTQEADKGSEFTGWSGACTGTGSCEVTMSEAKEVTANFDEIPGPTNLRTVTIAKNANGPGGTGSVSSKPKGIKCGTTCSSATARLYKEQKIELVAKPTLTSAFLKWENAKEGGVCDGSTSATCTIPEGNKEDISLEAIYSGTAKTITPTETLTLSKGDSEQSFGKGTVKAAGLGCEADCDETKVLYQGPIGGEKPKAGKVVILKQAPAFGSAFVGWTGCTEISETECEVKMESAKEVTAEYAALPNKVLTVNKAYASGNGSVSSKPKGIKCATTCTQAVAQMPEGANVELLAKPGTETTFVKWEGGDCNGSTNPVCIVEMNVDETTKAVFSKAGKAFLGGSEPTLTLTKEGIGAKAGEGGYGTVKASGLTCEVLCSSTSVLYQGPLGGEKPKAGKVVILKALSAPGSTAVTWSGCTPIGETECEVKMEASKEVTATFNELE